MIIRMAFLIFVVFIGISSILLDKVSNIPLLLLSGVVLLLGIFLEPRFPRLRYVQIVLLACFHSVSHLNWCIMMYFMLAGKEAYRKKVLWRSMLIATCYMAVYSAMRLIYSPASRYNYMATIYDQLSILGAIAIVYYLVITQSEKQKLQRENNNLSMYDPLTGLLNFQEFHRQLETLIRKQPIGLLLIDCLDLTATNNQQGYEHGDNLLKKFARILPSFFTDAYLIARYGDDKFAVVLRYAELHEQMQHIHGLMLSEIPKSLGIQVTFGYASCADKSITKDELLLLAEAKLAEMRRDIWLQREEHMLRSEKLKLIGELAAGMAHEIRNPLTTIRGFLQVAKENNYNIEPYFPVVMAEITRISELTGEFLQFSKPHMADFKPRSLQECIERVIQLMESEALLFGHHIRYEADPETILILMDKDKIVQLLINLIKNAFEAMKEPGTVTVALSREEESGKAMLCLEDTGTGIPEQYQADIFNPFFTTKSSGTGLGLSICHKIVQDHAGSIQFTSSQQGTRFTISFPIVH